MTSQELTIKIINRVKKRKIFIISSAFLFTILLVIFTVKSPATYTSTSIIFPLTAASDNSATSSALSALFSGSDNSNNPFSDEASVNIIELSLSRTTRENVASIKDTSEGNKTFAELLIRDINNHRSLLEQKLDCPSNEDSLIAAATKIFKDNLTATINKNNSFVLTYTGRSPALVKKISYGFIDKISTFYINLKSEKAKRDFEFASGKVDSLSRVIHSKDNKLIAMDQKTLFTNTNKMEFKVPTENIITEKEMLRQQYAIAVANQQNAAYKLQKATPVIKVLDYPDAPYDVQKKSPILYSIIGLILGLVISIGYFTFPLFIQYAKEEINKAIYGQALPVATKRQIAA